MKTNLADVAAFAFSFTDTIPPDIGDPTGSVETYSYGVSDITAFDLTLGADNLPTGGYINLDGDEWFTDGIGGDGNSRFARQAAA